MRLLVSLCCLWLLPVGCRFDRSGVPALSLDQSGPDAADTGQVFEDGPTTDVASTDSPPAPDGGPTCDWGYRRKLTFDTSTLTEDLLAFPVLVVLDATRIDFGKVQPGGGDLRFTDSDGVTVIPHEIDHWDPAGQSFLWVKVPQIDKGSTTDHIWLYYNNTGPMLSKPGGPWGPAFLGVYHLDDDPTGIILDSSVQGSHLSPQGEIPATAVVPGKVGPGIELSGSGQALTGKVAIAPAVYTLEAWIKLDAVGSPKERHIVELKNVQFFVETNAKLEAGSGLDEFGALGPTELQTGIWYHVALVQRATGWVIYLNGQIESSGPEATNPGLELFVGRVYANGYPNTYLDGVMDEVRVTGIDRSDAWIATQHQSMTDKLLGYGPELRTDSGACPQ